MKRWTIIAAAALLAGCNATTPATETTPSAETTPVTETTPPAETSPATATTPSTETSPADEATPADEPFQAAPLEGNDFPALNTSRLITDIRAAEHDDFARLVIEFSEDASGKEDASAGYSLDYVTEAISDGRGEPIKVTGEKILDIRLSGILMPEEAKTRPFGEIPGTETFTQIESVGPFEGMSQIVIGLTHEGPVRVSELTDPYRLVIDVEE